jgi:hypothetical protein
MPRMIVVDGPEKSGKSTLLDEIEQQAMNRGYFMLKHHWNKPQPNHFAHRKTLLQQYTAARIQEQTYGKKGLILWNRSQASEVIYSRLLNRPGTLKNNPIVGEFNYGRAQLALGPRVILLGPSAEALVANRDATDLAVDPNEEREAFRQYGTEFNFEVYENPYDKQWVKDKAKELLDRLDDWQEESLSDYAGPPNPTYIVLTGSATKSFVPFEGSGPAAKWLELGGPAMTVGFATLEASKETLRRARIIGVPEKTRQSHLKSYALYYLGYPESRVTTVVDIISRLSKTKQLGAKS